ncbi:MAG: diguanylate cyclase [Betaproteobacteria bacterium]
MVVTANPRFDELKTSGKLPSPAGVALAIIELCRKDDVSIEEIGYAVRADPALSGRIIKFANSALHGPRRAIVSVPEAIQLIGINTVRQLVLGFSLLGQHRNGACAKFDYTRFWSRSLAVAIAASAVCMRVRSAAPEEAFTCGLLAGVGTLALATIYPVEYSELVASPGGKSVFELSRLEQERFATDHNELAAALLQDWHLPRLFVVSVFHHEVPERGGLPDGTREFMVCNLLHLAAAIGDMCVIAESERKSCIPDLILAAARVGIDEAVVYKLWDEVRSQWGDWGRILEIKTQDMRSLEDLQRDNTQVPLPQAKAQDPAEGPVESLTVLVVEDDRSTLLLIEHVLKSAGHMVHTAQDGRSGLALAMSLRPQIIISDWIMPGLDGVSFCKALRQTEEGQQMYFIILSALEQDDQLVEAFESGVDDYVTKPFTARVLAARLRAGRRVIKLQEHARRDSENLRRFAAELAVANRRLQQAALTDPLTGLPNRRYGMERLEQEWAASTRTLRPLTCMVIDVDQFKQVNDNFGHDSGDVVLRHVASVLRKEARTEDVICRLGGEEFLVISPDTSLTAGLSLAERLRVGVERARASTGSNTHSPTVSIGVAQRDAKMLRMDELIKTADTALYDAKRAGRNRVAPATPKAGVAS